MSLSGVSCGRDRFHMLAFKNEYYKGIENYTAHNKIKNMSKENTIVRPTVTASLLMLVYHSSNNFHCSVSKRKIPSIHAFRLYSWKPKENKNWIGSGNKN